MDRAGTSSESDFLSSESRRARPVSGSGAVFQMTMRDGTTGDAN